MLPFVGNRISYEAEGMLSNTSQIPLHENYLVPASGNKSQIVTNSTINCEHVFIKSVFVKNQNVSEVIVGWNSLRPSGTIFLFVHDPNGNIKRELFLFSPVNSECSGQEIHTSGNITNVDSVMHDKIHVAVNSTNFKLYLTGEKFGNLTFDLFQMRTWPPNIGYQAITLKQGQREDPFMVSKINNYNVTGLHYLSYPLALLKGIPVTLHPGDSVSNGCNEILTLVTIESDHARFVKKTEPDNRCPI